MHVKLPEMQLVLWEKQEMPDRKKDEKTGEWVSTGQTIEKTLYTFRDEFGEVLKFFADNEYREMEGSMVTITANIIYNDYKRQNQVKLEHIEQIA